MELAGFTTRHEMRCGGQLADAAPEPPRSESGGHNLIRVTRRLRRKLSLIRTGVEEMNESTKMAGAGS